jgi:drug/metabolite transporter (DMT)-like permease
MTLESVFGVTVSVLFGERPTIRLYIGFLLIFLAILVSETKLAFLNKKKIPA